MLHGVSQSQEALPYGNKKPTYIRQIDHMNMAASGEFISTRDYSVNATIKAANIISKNQGKRIRKNLKTFSVVSNSDVSTAVAPSQIAKGHRNMTCNSVNFGELGVQAMISETPRSN